MFDVAFALSLVGMYLQGLWLTNVDARPAGGWLSALSSITLLALVTAASVGALCGGIARAVTGYSWIRLFGTMCFSIYLIHVVVIQGLASLVLQHLLLRSPALIYGCYLITLLPASFLISFFFYICIERPFMMGSPFQTPLLWWYRKTRTDAG
jgi:peptidoglycan/LPS O-acetylase OafA/YrhL